MPHCPSYQELDAILENANASFTVLGSNHEQLVAIVKDLKQCRAFIAKLKTNDELLTGVNIQQGEAIRSLQAEAEATKQILYAINEDVGGGDLPLVRSNIAKAVEANVVDRLAEYQAEIERLSYSLACVLCHATGGRMSKTNYTKEAMYGEIDAHIERLIEEDREPRDDE